ncbi:hypothetical protein BBJ29_008312 [Phytophthora kernoviae]|uniref:GH16 domain-containing protein n=1 Tax=Phytophthora kernoviae TaxID=325452 RepID=A0A421G9P6_9STRA|nr:hypothetical protein BBJ29_008312 [Phytophthora kernoviae]
MTDTVTESDGRGVFRIKVMEEENITYTVYNTYAKPAGFETHYMYYRAGMMQSWNKFCFQGGRMEVVAQLPATTSSSNPDMGNDKARVKTASFYPTWPGIWLLVHLAAYTTYVKYQLEWVTGSEGYIRWMVEDIVIFEITAESIENVPQDDNKSNPKKIMLEEPMYIIFNVALSTSWGAVPPNPGEPCRGDGTNAQTNAICDGFPMYMKIDYIRIYQDLSKGSDMSIGCDPDTHPTAQWIKDHIDEYETPDNKVIEVTGGASCKHDYDCTVSTSFISTGTCRKDGRCHCGASGAWGGPRCTTALSDTSSTKGYGPSMAISAIYAALAIVVFALALYKIMGQQNKKAMVVGAGVTGPAILSKVEMEDIPRSVGVVSGASDEKLV